MVAHKAAFDAGEVERLVILVVVIPATGINTSAPRMTTTSITRRSTSPASNAALWDTIATTEHHWRMLMFNSWSNLRMWETHLSEGIQIFRIVSDKWVSFFIRPDKCTPESETSTEHLSEGIRIFLIASDKCYLFCNNHILWTCFRGLQIFFLTVGQMMFYQFNHLLSMPYV